MTIYVVCEEDSFGSDPVAAYTSEEAAYEHESRLKHPNGTCSGEVFEIELITDAQVEHRRDSNVGSDALLGIESKGE